jgi:hypothetical protein
MKDAPARPPLDPIDVIGENGDTAERSEGIAHGIGSFGRRVRYGVPGSTVVVSVTVHEAAASRITRISFATRAPTAT